MRFWPFVRRRRYMAAGVTADSLPLVEDALRRGLDDFFVVKERETRGPTLRWGGRLRTEPARALPIAEALFKPYGYTPFLKQEGDLTWIEAVPLANVVARSRPGLTVTLFLLTV